MDVIGNVPPEIAIKIFSYLEEKDLVHCTIVSKKWNQLVNCNLLWKKFCDEDLIDENFKVEKSSGVEKLYQCSWAKFYYESQRRLLSNWVYNNPYRTTFHIASSSELATDGNFLVIATWELAAALHIYDIRTRDEPRFMESLYLPLTTEGCITHLYVRERFIVCKQGWVVTVFRRKRFGCFELDCCLAVREGKMVIIDGTEGDGFSPVQKIYLLSHTVLVSTEGAVLMWNLNVRRETWRTESNEYKYYYSDGQCVYFISGNTGTIIDQSGRTLLHHSPYSALFLYGNKSFFVGVSVVDGSYKLQAWDRAGKQILQTPTPRPYGWTLHPSLPLLILLTCPSPTASTLTILHFDPYSRTDHSLPFGNLAHASLFLLTPNLLAVLHRENWDLKYRHFSLVHLSSALVLYTFEISSQYLLDITFKNIIYKQTDNELEILNYR